MRRLIRSEGLWLVLILVAIAIITANSFFALRTIDDLSQLERRLEQTESIVDAVNDLHVGILRIESGQRGYLLAEDIDFLSDYRETLDKIVFKLDRLAGLRSNLSSQQERLDELVALAREKINYVIGTVELARSGNLEEAENRVESERGLDLYALLEMQFNAINTTEMDMQYQHRSELNAVLEGSKLTFVISAIMTTLMIVAIFALVYRTNRETRLHHRALEAINAELEAKVAARTQTLEVYADELARSNRELEDFAFVASHDLQEPLRKIQAFGDRLKKGYDEALDERGQDFLSRMLNAASRMSALISDLLEFSRVSTRGKPFVPVNLNQIVSDVLEDLEIVIAESGAVVTVEDLPEIDADPSQMNQLFLNLIANGIKFRRKEVTPELVISARHFTDSEVEKRDLNPAVGWYQVSVRDNGIGFEQTYEDKIFAPFQRLHGRSEYEGTGIGLAVCRRIVERHNGRIRAFGEPSKGATFTITIPKSGGPFNSELNQENGSNT